MKQSKKIPSTIPRKSRKYLLIFILIAIIAVAAVFLALTRQAPSPAPSGTNSSFQSAGALYSKSVDLANEGKYQDALGAADQALALNVSSLTPLIQANRAGILVMLGDNAGAIAAADVAISAEGNLTTTRSIAWFNKGNALRNLGMIDEARAAYANATALDPTLQPPKI
ncbi:tetratricopeptide repeat protein [Methanoregula sp.]|uniref:tetratricopeptide repeat protein n=1 Tax=Methanoregula sp. TaxID=2052170 RepID=UPI003C726785